MNSLTTDLQVKICELEEQLREAMAIIKKIDGLDFVITLPDRMDAVRNITRPFLNSLEPNKDKIRKGLDDMKERNK